MRIPWFLCPINHSQHAGGGSAHIGHFTLLYFKDHARLKATPESPAFPQPVFPEGSYCWQAGDTAGQLGPAILHAGETDTSNRCTRDLDIVTML